MTESKRYIFSGMKLLTNSHSLVKDQAVLVEEKKIKAIISTAMIKHHLPAIHVKLPADSYLVPGFIDTHVHGAMGADVMDATPEALTTISKALAAEGVTGFLATTMTAPDQQIENALIQAMNSMNNLEGAALLGVHLEGPFIAKEKMGAQQGKYVRDPDIDLVKHWQSVSNNVIKLLTFAPELPNATEFIRAVRQMGITPSIGHTNATFKQTQSAILAGCLHATHLFNAMSGIHQRAPGASGALLLSEKVTAEIIVDGIHLHPPIVELIYRLKHKNLLMLVTDAMRAKCCQDGEYDLGGQQILVREGIASLSDGTLAGSTLRMNHAVKNMMAYTGCSLEDAVMMASLNPARMLGIEANKGSIDIGKDADLTVLNAELNVLLTMRAGMMVYRLKDDQHAAYDAQHE